MDWPVAESRLPVGSSASTIAGRPARARAIATRCRSPAGQLGRPGAQLVAEADPVQRRGGQASRRSRQAGPGVQQPVGDVVQHGRRARPGRTAGTRTRCCVARSAGQLPGRPASATSRPVTRTVPVVGRSSVPIRCSSVRLPRPDGPSDRDQLPRRDARRLTPRSAAHRRRARIGLGHLVQLQHHSRPPRRRAAAPAASVRCSYRRHHDVLAGGQLRSGDLDQALPRRRTAPASPSPGDAPPGRSPPPRTRRPAGPAARPPARPARRARCRS